MLRKANKLPEDWKNADALFGEHLLDRFPDKTIGLVESEKTALVADAVFPHYLWLATGGATRNLDRAIAVLSGRRVVVFPDADVVEKWTEHFHGIPGWTVSLITKDHAAQHGPEWSKCDLCDILIQESIRNKKTA
jgi:hypothetical protein